MFLLKEKNYFGHEYDSYYKEFLTLIENYSVLHQKSNNEILENESEDIVYSKAKLNLIKNSNI